MYRAMLHVGSNTVMYRAMLHLREQYCNVQSNATWKGAIRAMLHLVSNTVMYSAMLHSREQL